MNEITVLVLDDEDHQAELNADLLDNEGLDTDKETDPLEAIDSIQENDYDAVVSDYEMPELDGIEVLDEAREIEPDLPFIIFTGKGSEEIASEAISHGVTDYFQKDGELETYGEIASKIEEVVGEPEAVYEDDLEPVDLPFEGTIADANHYVYITDYSGRIQFVSDTVAEATGYSKDELIGETPDLLNSGQQTDEFYEELWSTIKEGKIWKGQILNHTKDGEEFMVEQKIAPVELDEDVYFVAYSETS